MSHYKEALEFREAMGQVSGVLVGHVASMQYDLIAEEFLEFTESFAGALHYKTPRAREEALKELADLAYVCYQLAASCGWDLDRALYRVHDSNMSKLVDGKPLKRDDGKVLKGPNYKKPDLSDLV